MRWRRLTYDEKRSARLKRMRTWQRRFALWFYHDPQSHTVYWLEYVWVRWTDRDKDGFAPWEREVRGGRDCPEVKSPSSPLPDAAEHKDVHGNTTLSEEHY